MPEKKKETPQSNTPNTQREPSASRDLQKETQARDEQDAASIATNADPDSNVRIAWDAYSKAVGGVAFNGDKLPTWDEMAADEKKQKQVQAWRASTDAVVNQAKPTTRESKPSNGGELTFDANIDSVLPTGSGRDTFTVVLHPLEEGNEGSFRRPSGRIELNDVRNELGKALEGKAKARVTIVATA